MATITIRNLDDTTRDRLRVRAARNGRSMEAEVRALLDAAVRSPGKGLGTRIRSRFDDADAEFDLPRRDDAPRAADFAE